MIVPAIAPIGAIRKLRPIALFQHSHNQSYKRHCFNKLHYFNRLNNTVTPLPRNPPRNHSLCCPHWENTIRFVQRHHFCDRIPSVSKMEVTPGVLGVEIRGIDLKKPVTDELIQKFREDVHKHRLLIFKDQGVVSGDRQVEISKWFGELESTFYKHPKSPHPDVFRVSNVKEEGCTNVGRTGWHIDGSFMEKPFAFSLYHMDTIPKSGDTAFIPLTELIESVPAETQERWNRLWMVGDRRDQSVHPLIYPHPVTGRLTLCFHLGMTNSFLWDYDSENERRTEWPETARLLQEIHDEIVKDNRKLIYSHKWEIGDFIVSDNLAVGHEATPETQFDVSRVGLRVLHRTTIRGTNIPRKKTAT